MRPYRTTDDSKHPNLSALQIPEIDAERLRLAATPHLIDLGRILAGDR